MSIRCTRAGKIKKIVPGGKGRPMAMDMGKLEEAIKTTLRTCSAGNSNTVKLSAVKKVYETNSKEQAAKDGLNTESINCSVADQTAKVGMMAVTMGRKELKLTKKKLITKTLPRVHCRAFCHEWICIFCNGSCYTFH